MRVCKRRLYFLVSALNLIAHRFVGLWQGFASLLGFRSTAVAGLLRAPWHRSPAPRDGASATQS